DNGIGMQDRTIKIWRASDGILVRTLTPGFGISKVAFSSDGRFLAAAHQSVFFGEHSVVDIWNVEDGSLVRSIQPGGRQVSTIAYSPKSSLLGIVTNVGAIQLYDPTGQLQQVLAGRAGSGLAFSPDESTLAATSTQN